MMVDNLQLEPLSVQFCGELMPQAHIDMCSIIDISNPYLTVNPPRLPVPMHEEGRASKPKATFENLGFHFRSLFRRFFGRFSAENFRIGSL